MTRVFPRRLQRRIAVAIQMVTAPKTSLSNLLTMVKSFMHASQNGNVLNVRFVIRLYCYCAVGTRDGLLGPVAENLESLKCWIQATVLGDVYLPLFVLCSRW